MMQAIKQSSLPKSKWYYMGTTISQSTAMAFDRFRIANSQNIQVGIIPPSTSNPGTPDYQIKTDEAGIYIYDSQNIIEQQQPFYTGGGWTASSGEHDFTFDCSSYTYGGTNLDSAAIFIKGWLLANVTWQLYAYPTGYGGTRNKNAELQALFLDTLRMNTVGSEIARLRLTNQPIVGISNSNTITSFKAKEVRLEGTSINIVTGGLRLLVLGGATTGTLSYDSVHRPDGDLQAQQDYDTLISRSWSIVGGRPIV